MTTGNRIASKRKEMGLTQEALGEQLGVSRQAIYKWETDAALPEIDKLIILSRLFGVTVDWLLGMEESSENKNDMQEAPLQAEEPPQISGTNIHKVALILALAALILSLINLSRFHHLLSSTQTINTLQNEVNGSLSDEISALSEKYQQILALQNSLLSKHSTAVLSGNIATNTVTFSFLAASKHDAEGMKAYIRADSEDSSQLFGPFEAKGSEFSGQVTVSLSDHISLFLILESDGNRETQFLDTYEHLFHDTIPTYTLNMESDFGPILNSKLNLGNQYLCLDTGIVPSDIRQAEGLSPTKISKVRIGLFQNETFLCEAFLCDSPYGPTEENGQVQYYMFPEKTVFLSPNDTVYLGIQIVDDHGRCLTQAAKSYALQFESDETGYWLTEVDPASVPEPSLVFP